MTDVPAQALAGDKPFYFINAIYRWQIGNRLKELQAHLSGFVSLLAV